MNGFPASEDLRFHLNQKGDVSLEDNLKGKVWEAKVLMSNVGEVRRKTYLYPKVVVEFH